MRESRRATPSGARARLVPRGAPRGHAIGAATALKLAALAEDYAGMLANGLLLDGGEPFETLIERCADIEARANISRTGA